MGWLWTPLLNGMLGMAGYWVARDAFREPAGPPRILATATLAWAWATLGMELLGPIGCLSRGALLLWTGLGLAIGVMSRIRRRSSPLPPCGGGMGWGAEGKASTDEGLGSNATPHPLPPPQGGRGKSRTESNTPGHPNGSEWGISATLALALIAWGAISRGVGSMLEPVKVVSDGPIYHLYFAARWWRAGRLFLIATPFGENAATYFPAVGDLWFTWLMIGWGGDRLAKVGQAPFLLLAALAAYALARRLGAGASASWIAASWFVASTPLFLFSFEANVDTVFVAGYLVAAYFLVRHALGDGGAGTLTIGLLAAGGALGTKPTGIVFVPVLLILAALAVWRRPISTRQRLAQLALIPTLPLVMAGFWFGRNAWLTANPLYPLHVEAFGRVWLAGWYPADAMRLSRYYMPVGDWRALADILLAVLDPRLAPIWVAAMAGAWRIGRRARPEERGVWGSSALAVLNVALYWLAIPYRTQQRFMLHALALAVVPLARLLDRGRWLRGLAVALLAIHMLTHQGWPIAPPRGPIPWDLSRVVPNALAGVIPFPRTGDEFRELGADPLGLGLVLLPAVVGLAIGRAWGRALRRPSPGRGAVAAAITAGLLALTCACYYRWGDPPGRHFFPRWDYFAAWRELDRLAPPEGVRVAYAGTNLPYYLLGTGLRNEVRYINIDEHADWLIHDYHREGRSEGRPTWPHPRPGWDRVRPGPGPRLFAAWLANLRAERIQYLVVARPPIEEGPHNINRSDPSGFPIERAWADSHPEIFVPVFGMAERDPEIRIYRVLPAGKKKTTEGPARSHS